MTNNPKKTDSGGGAPTATAITLLDVLDALERREGLSVTRRRDLVSGVKPQRQAGGGEPGRRGSDQQDLQ
jgi:hypothetical protein